MNDTEDMEESEMECLERLSDVSVDATERYGSSPYEDKNERITTAERTQSLEEDISQTLLQNPTVNTVDMEIDAADEVNLESENKQNNTVQKELKKNYHFPRT